MHRKHRLQQNLPLLPQIRRVRCRSWQRLQRREPKSDSPLRSERRFSSHWRVRKATSEVRAAPLEALRLARVGKASENLVGASLIFGPGLVDVEGDLVGDGDAVAFEGYYLFRMIGEDANVF